jgi:glycosyltransferase involved in cell wall biosynthesis
VVSLNLLPFLWRQGVLGGRTFDVLMTRQPLAELQSALDLAHQRHPESRTLADFRVSPEVAAAESEALAEARHWITPHRGVAKLGGNKSVLLDWALPSVSQVDGEKARIAFSGSAGASRSHPATPMEGEKTKIAFPASTLGRKGAYELRDVAKRLGLRIALGGGVIEDARFWAGLDAAPAAGHWLSGARAVVLPAWVEHQPRRLLQALAAGVPVIATTACGLEGLSGVISVPKGDTAALERALERVLAR